MPKRLFGTFLLVTVMALVLANKSFAVVLEKGTDKVSALLMTNFDEINPNQDLEVLVRFKMSGDWHIFSETPSIAGYPTKVEWKLPDGFEVKDIRWSKDKKFVTEGIEQFGYGGTAYYTAGIVPPRNEWAKKFPLEVKISWLACAEECAPETVFMKLELPYTSHDLMPSSAFAEEMVKAEKSFFEPAAENRKIPAEKDGLALIMLMALAGGIILNFMPCVFPILTLKIISLSQGLTDKRKSRIEALLYALGVVLSFLLVAGILAWLRAKGEQIGWGFQLQSPFFVGVMLGIFVIIFFMLIDVVDFCSPLAGKIGGVFFKNDKLNAFITGFFAVLIASPCTAPFMGIAVGYALSRPVYVYFPVFFAMGIGYALPFALAGFYPEVLRKILPRPGKWMDILKKFFAVPVFLTCVWLGWVLYNQKTDRPLSETGLAEWQVYDVSEVEKLREQNKPVFIVFTAKWCITCLVNEKTVLSGNVFSELVKRREISLFKADWTSRDDYIAKALEAYGRNSVPLYVYYDGRGDYRILPQLLTSKIVAEYLDK